MDPRTFCPQSCATGSASLEMLCESSKYTQHLPSPWRVTAVGLALVLPARPAAQQASCPDPGGRRLSSSAVDTHAVLRLPSGRSAVLPGRQTCAPWAVSPRGVNTGCRCSGPVERGELVATVGGDRPVHGRVRTGVPWLDTHSLRREVTSDVYV